MPTTDVSAPRQTVSQALKKYREMRDFAITSEPKGSARPKRHNPPIFVVQEHHASHLHYDFRLEMDGVLKSWAVPKGLSSEPGVRRLAIHTEDHPLEYALFEGRIPEGEYGGGVMSIWDSGTYEHLENSSYEEGRLRIRLAGEKLAGEWALARTSPDAKQWMLTRRRDTRG